MRYEDAFSLHSIYENEVDVIWSLLLLLLLRHTLMVKDLLFGVFV